MTNFEKSRQTWGAINDLDEAITAIKEGNIEKSMESMSTARQKMVVIGNEFRYGEDIRKTGRFFHD